MDKKCDPTISISEIKNLYFDSREKASFIAKLKEKLNNAVNINEFDQNFDQFMITVGQKLLTVLFTT